MNDTGDGSTSLPYVSPEETMNETRYQAIVDRSKVSLFGLLKAARREDPGHLMPKVIAHTIATAKRIPRSLVIRSGPRQEQYVHDTFTQWAEAVCRTVGMEIQVLDSWKVPIQGPCLFVSNHLSPMDIPVLVKTIPHPAAFVANIFFSKLPVFSYWTRKSGSVFIDQGNPAAEFEAVKQMAIRLTNGKSLILFPEGYIHQKQGLAEFKRGGMHAAVMAHAPIVPVCLYGTQHVMAPGRLCVVPSMRVTVLFGDPVYPDSLSREERKNLHNSVRENMLDMLSYVSGIQLGLETVSV